MQIDVKNKKIVANKVFHMADMPQRILVYKRKTNRKNF